MRDILGLAVAICMSTTRSVETLVTVVEDAAGLSVALKLDRKRTAEATSILVDGGHCIEAVSVILARYSKPESAGASTGIEASVLSRLVLSLRNQDLAQALVARLIVVVRAQPPDSTVLPLGLFPRRFCRRCACNRDRYRTPSQHGYIYLVVAIFAGRHLYSSTSYAG